MLSRLSSLVPAALVLAVLVVAQDDANKFPATPLASKHFAYPTGIPYQADSENLIRGTQFGYNRCNASTENQDSLCQTSFLDSLDDFCLWAPSKPDSLIANTEGEEVAWCTKPGHGTRLIPEGALKGVQFMRTPDYIQVVGFIDQTKINIQAGDYGGELDPHGADLRGNPLGGLVYSNAWGGNGDNFQQVIEWHNFMGGDAFCFKTCDPSKPNAAHFCEHRYDRIGCAYNAPNNAQQGVFEACDGDNQDYPGIYTADGAVVTYTQPPESLGPITSIPYTARVPASSNCVQFPSSSLYRAAPATTTASPTTTPASASASASMQSHTNQSSSSPAPQKAAQEQNSQARLVTTSILGSLFCAALAGVLLM